MLSNFINIGRLTWFLLFIVCITNCVISGIFCIGLKCNFSQSYFCKTKMFLTTRSVRSPDMHESYPTWLWCEKRSWKCPHFANQSSSCSLISIIQVGVIEDDMCFICTLILQWKWHLNVQERRSIKSPSPHSAQVTVHGWCRQWR